MIPTSKGYFVRLPDIDPQTDAANAYLENNSGRIYLWVSDLITDFEMGGNTAQSIRKRQFFPHNFVQPRITIKGQTPNQDHYGRLGEFVRDSQIQALESANPLTRLVVRGGGKRGRTVRGSHQPWRLSGYIENMPRGGERFVNAPTFEFAFICSVSETGLYRDTRPTAASLKLMTWTEIFTSAKGTGYVTDPDKQNHIPVDDNSGSGTRDTPVPLDPNNKRTDAAPPSG